ncbi:hypothetical protein D0469_05975 [Peribacillus saganii]|uniref:Uncharacterized protein n=1 Tax=Peribacillus saganii TaxID=2303992 RepID=A0A372LQI1_9BACI|nr:hypothetical protein [Peribacillus saganii]RFU70479.1 hypothetical protein D0469_05975 [Peribacillus saganii]
MNSKLFDIFQMGTTLKLKMKDGIRFLPYYLYVDKHCLGQFYPQSELYFDTRSLGDGTHRLTVSGVFLKNRETVGYVNRFQFNRDTSRDLRADFKAGDILIACDNVNGFPPGYMGHSAIVVDDSHVVEAIIMRPFIKKDTIEQFIVAHPLYAHYRPKSEEMGTKAANFALSYLATYQDNAKNGKKNPVFSFTTKTPLEDLLESIYCSKLIWLSYYYGAHYKFYNDHFLFSPEDLETGLSQDENFTLIYKHHEFVFHLNS